MKSEASKVKVWICWKPETFLSSVDSDVVGNINKSILISCFIFLDVVS